MIDSNNSPVEKLLQLQRGFKSKLAQRLSDIESDWRDSLNTKSPDFTGLHIKVHSLVGTSGTFGASMVSTAAKRLEEKIKLLLNGSLTLDSDVEDQIEFLILQLIEVSSKWFPSSIPFIPENKKEQNVEMADWRSNIFLVEDDVVVAKYLNEFLQKSGYKVFYYRKLKEFEEDYGNNHRASAIIMDVTFDEGVIAGAETIQSLSEKDENFPPVIFISVHDDIQARLAAAKAGANRYFTKPIDNQKLLDSLDKLTHRIQQNAYRVLLIDDEKDLLEYYSTCLEHAGMEVISFTNPLEAYETIDTFHPEIIILDLYMPECSGFDFAKVIRQNDERASIPIIYLSSELDAGTQLAAMDLGGDDFLLKPVNLEYFVQSITTRVKRARRIQELNEDVKNALRESEYRLVTLDQHAIISMTDTSGKIIFANERFVAISGFKEEELIGQNHRILKSSKHSPEFYKEMWETISAGKIWNGHVCNKAKDGSEYWVESTIVPFSDENGVPYKYVSVRTDITEIKKSEEDALDSERRLLKQQHTLNTLSSVTDYVLLEEAAFFKIVTQRAAETLNVDRVSIFLLSKNNKEIICRNLYEKKDEKWSSGLIFERELYPNYFSAIEKNIVVVADDAHTNIATAEFSKSHLSPLGIGAMLHAPIRQQGHVVGVICCEHVGGKRQWRSDEQSFVLGLADLISLNIESSERKAAESKLEEALEFADSANNAKSEFLSSMSHELRTPMNAISGFAQLLLLDVNNRLDEIQKSNVSEIIKASNHLLELINEVLNLSKIESGHVDLSIDTVSYSDVVKESISLMGTLIESRNIKTDFTFNNKNLSVEEISEIDVFMHVDRMRIKQILLNLLSNAVKYNQESGKITLACDVSNNIIRISVIDTGKGISEEGKKELFKSFNRLGEEGGSIEGSGIGLVITRKLVELMGGSIGVESEVNVGSTFWIEFPQVISPTKINDKSNKETSAKLDESFEHKILYIEDNPANLRLVEQIISSKTDVEMLSSHDPGLGLELALSESPDLILLDINLPGMSGYDVLKKLKESNVTKDIPVFAVSANAMLIDIEKGMKAGFDDYIAKPIDIEYFLNAVKKVLK